jgi:hypothetical protein
MKQILLLFSGVSILASCNNTSSIKSAEAAKNTDLLQQNLTGTVQRIEQSTFSVDSTGKSKQDSLVSIMDFDEKGYQPAYSTKDLTGKIHADQTIKHDDKGTFLEIVSKKDGKPDYKLETEIDKDGKYIGGKRYDSSGKQEGYFTDLMTNEYGAVYAGKYHKMNGDVFSWWNSSYKGPLYVGGSSSDSMGKVSYVDSVKLDNKGNTVEDVLTTKRGADAKTEKTTFKYDAFDDQGNWTQRTTYNEKGKATKIEKRNITYYKK